MLLGHEQGKRGIGGFLNSYTTGENGIAPFGFDPKLDGDSSPLALLFAMTTHALPRLFGGCEFRDLRSAWTAFFGFGVCAWRASH